MFCILSLTVQIPHTQQNTVFTISVLSIPSVAMKSNMLLLALKYEFTVPCIL